MTDSETRESVEAKREREREQRIASIKRWAEYVKSAPVEEWGPQLNRLIESQLAAAREADRSREQYRRVKAATEDRRDADASEES